LTITKYSTTTITISVSHVLTSTNSTTVVPRLTSDAEPQLTPVSSPLLNTTHTGVPGVQPATNMAVGSNPNIVGLSYINLPGLLLAILVFSWVFCCI
jgi:hypothetical protein